MDCYETNKTNKICYCLYCECNFKLNYTELKENDIITYGFSEFMYCYNCLNTRQPIQNIEYGRLDKLTFESDIDEDTLDEWLMDEERDLYVKYCDRYYEDGCNPVYKYTFDECIRILGTTSYFEHEKNIKKKISNCLQSDNKKKFEISGDEYITVEDIDDFLVMQSYTCKKCGDRVLTEGYKPYCCNQFSIDRINNSLPHNKDNVVISCYFCNCKGHPLYDKDVKHCDINGCDCRILLNLT